MIAFLGALEGAVAQGLVWGIMAIGLYISYKVLDFSDLTVDGSICTGAVVCTALVTTGTNVYVAILIAFLAGCATGLITGLFHTLMGIPPILSGILTQLMLWSINLKILGRANVALSSRTYDLALTQLDITGSIVTLSLCIAIIIGILYFFFGTELGSSIRATGNNEKMSRALGINVEKNKIIGLMLSNGIVALSGAMLAQYQGYADINMGRGAIVIGLAAIIIGQALFSKISNNFAVRLVSTAIGGVIYYIVYQIVIFIGLDADLLKMLSALVVAVFLAVPYWKKKYGKSKIKQKADKGV